MIRDRDRVLYLEGLLDKVRPVIRDYAAHDVSSDCRENIVPLLEEEFRERQAFDDQVRRLGEILTDVAKVFA